MNSFYRSIYRADLMVFAALAIPGLNLLLIDILLNGEMSLEQSGIEPALIGGLCGLFGILGAAFSYFRIATPESRVKVQTSLFVKIAAVAWLAYLAATVSSLFILIAMVDLMGAIAFLLALYK
jgi:hypothetical protein